MDEEPIKLLVTATEYRPPRIKARWVDPAGKRVEVEQSIYDGIVIPAGSRSIEVIWPPTIAEGAPFTIGTDHGG